MKNFFGCFLALLIGILGLAIVFGLICLGAWLFQILPDFALAIIGGIILIGINIVTFLESYVWARRKRWYFPLSIIITVIVVIMVLCGIFG